MVASLFRENLYRSMAGFSNRRKIFSVPLSGFGGSIRRVSRLGFLCLQQSWNRSCKHADNPLPPPAGAPVVVLFVLPRGQGSPVRLG